MKMIRLLPILLLVGCTDLSDYPTKPSTPGKTIMNNDNHEPLLPTDSMVVWKAGMYSEQIIVPFKSPVDFEITNQPSWVKIDTNYPDKNKLVISGTPMALGKYRVDIKATSATGYDTTFIIIYVNEFARQEIVQ